MDNRAISPHAGGVLLRAGRSLDDCQAAMIMVHGRNAGPQNVLDLIPVIDVPGFAYLAPEADDNTWYPFSFMAEIERNEPGISSGLSVLGALVSDLAQRGVARERVVLLGFSQGACLAAEYAARHANRFGGVIVFSGGLIGPSGTTWDYPGSFDGTPVFLGCSDVDAHVPLQRVEESAAVFARMGADVDMRIYPQMGHLVNEDEVAAARTLMQRVVATP